MTERVFGPQDWESIASYSLAPARALAISIYEFPKDLPIVDLACGDNSQVDALLTRDFKAWGIDHDTNLLKSPLLKARDHVIFADICFLPFKNQSLGGITANAILDLLYIPKTERLAAEIGRCVTPRGFAIFSEEYPEYSNFKIFTGELREHGFTKEKDYFRKK